MTKRGMSGIQGRKGVGEGVYISACIPVSPFVFLCAAMMNEEEEEEEEGGGGGEGEGEAIEYPGKLDRMNKEMEMAHVCHVSRDLYCTIVGMDDYVFRRGMGVG